MLDAPVQHLARPKAYLVLYRRCDHDPGTRGLRQAGRVVTYAFNLSEVHQSLIKKQTLWYTNTQVIWKMYTVVKVDG